MTFVREETAGLERFTSDRTWAQVLDGLESSAEFRGMFRETLAASTSEAALWETPPFDPQAAFEMVLVPSPALARCVADPLPFAEWLDRPDPAVTFPNLGGDAQLVVPTRRGEERAYVHLLRFLRGADPQQVDAFWRTTATAIRTRVASRSAPVWISTNGLGVAWLHLRLDDRPKYFHHRPYRDRPGAGG